jgi:purine-nucleoside phosphorylase
MEQIKEASQYLKNQIGDFVPSVGIILGTGLGALANDIDIIATISYNDIPHFPIATAETHSGKLLFGRLGGQNIVCMQGRFHYYEGYNMKQVTFPIRVMKLLGVETLVVSNASGGLNPAWKAGDLMLITDHISLLLEQSPLAGKNLDEFGDRWPDMCDPYDLPLISKALAIAEKNQIPLKTGVYIGVTGPQLETRAEYRLLRMMGADAVGMSTVPEIIVARHCNMTCFGISVITDMGIPETLEKASIHKILAAAAQAEPAMALIIKELLLSM